MEITTELKIFYTLYNSIIQYWQSLRLFSFCFRVLRAMKAFEEEEALIMKDVPGWEVGKSVYNTKKWIPPHPAQLKDYER